MTAGSVMTVVRRPLGDDPALGHHDHPVGDVADHVHVVLDEEHGHALVFQVEDVVEQRLRERRVHAGHRLVEHDQGRVAHAGPGPSRGACAGRPRGCREVVLLGVELEARRAARRAFASISVPPACARWPGNRPGKKFSPALALGAEPHVVEDGQQAERLGQLEGADHARAGDLGGAARRESELPVERPACPASRLVESGEQVEQGRLAGAVRADEGGDGAALDLEVLDVDGGQAAEAAHAGRRPR